MRHFIVKDHAGISLAYVYFEDAPGRQAAAKLLTRDEARRIAVKIAYETELLQMRRRAYSTNASTRCAIGTKKATAARKVSVSQPSTSRQSGNFA